MVSCPSFSSDFKAVCCPFVILLPVFVRRLTRCYDLTHEYCLCSLCQATRCSVARHREVFARFDICRDVTWPILYTDILDSGCVTSSVLLLICILVNFFTHFVCAVIPLLMLVFVRVICVT